MNDPANYSAHCEINEINKIENSRPGDSRRSQFHGMNSIHPQTLQILERMTDGLIAIDLSDRERNGQTSGVVHYVNPAAAKLLCCTAESLIGLTGHELLQEIGLDSFGQQLQQTIETVTEIEFEAFISSLQIWVEVRVYRSSNESSGESSSESSSESSKELLVYLRDITQIKQQETIRQQRAEQIREQQWLLEQITEMIPGILYIYDLLEQRNVYVNSHICQSLGYTPAEIQAMGDRLFLELVHPDDLLKFPEQIARLHTLADGELMENEYRMRHRNGKWLWFSGRDTVFSRTLAGQPKQILGSAFDITNRKHLEQKQQFLLELNDSMRLLSEPEQVIQVTATLVSRYFQVDRCIYGEVDASEELLIIHPQICHGVINPATHYRMANYSPVCLAELKRGKTVAIENVTTDERCVNDWEAMAAEQAFSTLTVPLIKQSHLVAIFSLSHSQPRLWTTAEIHLIEEIADRIWFAVETLRTQRALRQSDARFQRLAHNVPGAICRYVRDASGRDSIPYISPSCRTLFELEPEVIQQDVTVLWQMLHPDDREELGQVIEESIATGEPIQWEGRYLLPSGKLKWVRYASRPDRLPDGSILWDGVATDVTPQKTQAAERERLLAQAQQYAQQLGGLTDAAIAINGVLSVEEVLQVITLQARSIIGAHQAVTVLKTGDTLEGAIYNISMSEKYRDWAGYSAKPTGQGIYAIVCKTNQPIRMSQAELESDPRWQNFGAENGKHPPMRGWLAAPLIRRDGQNLGLIQLSDKHAGDFTDADEDILMQLAQMASVAIENSRLYAAEQSARTQAEAANRIKDEFLAVLSHELRSPLNPILGWAKLLREQHLDRTATDRALEIIERNARLQTQLIEDLLDVSRILRGKMSLTISAVNLKDPIEAAIETVRLAAQAKSIHIQTDFPLENAIVSGDANRLQQVIWNLLSNAVKFTPNGGGVGVRLREVSGVADGEMGGWGDGGMGGWGATELGRWGATEQGSDRSAETVNFSSPPHPLTPSPPHPQYAQIIVTDTGKGIHPDFLPYVFDYFRQEDGATTRRFGGLGLGLAIVRHLVELHGGTVRAFSEGEGQGATFVVRLPLLGSGGAGEQGGRGAGESSGFLGYQPLSGMRILVVDDDDDTRELVTYALDRAGATLTAVNSAKAAIQAIARSEFDLLISDIGMPEMDGYMLMRQVRSLSLKNGFLPAIALTAYASELDQQQAMSVGFARHLAKPIDPEELVKVVVSVVRGG